MMFFVKGDFVIMLEDRQTLPLTCTENCRLLTGCVCSLDLTCGNQLLLVVSQYAKLPQVKSKLAGTPMLQLGCRVLTKQLSHML